MFKRFESSWQLAKASAAVLRADKELLIFPIISGIATLIITLSFFVPLAMTGAFDSLDRNDSGTLLLYAGVFVFYVVQYTVIFFCNTALVGAALIRLGGGDPTVADGFRIAFSRFGAIFGYALLSATVGMLLRAISERVGILGRIVVGLVGFVWTVATALVVPVLAVEDVGAVDAVKRSASLLKQTWGQQLIGNAGLGAAFGAITFAVVALSLTLIVGAAMIEQFVLMAVLAGIMVLAIIALALVQSALQGIYTAALYRYATAGEIDQHFNADVIRSAFRTR